MSVRHAILALLSEGPKYGLQLQKEFESSTGEVWPLNIGQVYTTLQRLERDGLYFVGLDIIGDYLTEVNVTSPTGVQEIDRLDGANLEGKVIDFVESRVAELKR